MPPQRFGSADFFRCKDCGAIFIKDFSSHHHRQCASVRKADFVHYSSVPSQSSDVLLHPHIQNGIFYGYVDEIELSEEQRKLPNSAVLMHPASMQLCKIAIHGLVIVHSHKNETLHIAWPCRNIRKTCIAITGVNECRLAPKDCVSVFPYRRVIQRAEKLTFHALLSSCDHYICSNDFKYFIRNRLSGTFIKSNSTMEVTYESQNCTLTLSNICSSEKEEGSMVNISLHSDISGQSASEELSENFAELRLSDSVSNISENDSIFFSVSESFVSEKDESFRENSSFLHMFSSPVCKCGDDLVLAEGHYPQVCRTDGGDVICATYFYVDIATTIDIEYDKNDANEILDPQLTSQDTVGLQEQMEIVRRCMNLFLDKEISFRHGVIFVGPSGTGKTLLANAIGSEYEVHFMKISSPEIFLLFNSGKEDKLREVFNKAWKKQPSIIFLDELDHLCEMLLDNQESAVSRLVALIDESLIIGRKVLMLAAANDINLVHNSLKRPSRFDVQIKFSMPGINERKMIMQKLLQRKSHTISDSQLSVLAKSTHGYSGYDLQQLCMEVEFRSYSSNAKYDGCENADHMSSISSLDMETVLKQSKPEVLRGDSYCISKVQWENVAGMQEVKEKLKQVIELPLKHPEVFIRFNITPPCGVLMYGPPGCSKTMIAKALATESNLNFMAVKGPELFSKWVGESEKAVRDLFKKAKEAAPCIIFFDEIDALVGERGSSDGSDAGKRVVTQLLTELDGVEQLKGVIVIAATNRPDILDLALVRPGRLDHLIYVPLPDAKTRKQLFQLKLNAVPICGDIDKEWLIEKTSGYSGAEVVALCSEAALLAMADDWPGVVEKPIITIKHFTEAFEIVLPRISEETIGFYEMFSANNTFTGKS